MRLPPICALASWKANSSTSAQCTRRTGRSHTWIAAGGSGGFMGRILKRCAILAVRRKASPQHESKMTPEQLTSFGADSLPGHLGIVIVAVGPGEVASELAVSKVHMAPNGFLHAGTVV